MNDCDEIAKQYAHENGYDILHASVAHNGYRYFHLDYTGRARYTGHPRVIKINTSGKVQQVLNLDEIYWACKNCLDPSTNLLE